MSSQETRGESSTDDGPNEERRTVLACPKCDSSDIRTNNNGLQGCKAPANHVCRDCGHAFSDADAVRRPLKRSVTTPPSIARTLENASPEDVGRPLTDGGHEPDYECRNCNWKGDECDRRDHYPVCPDCSRIVEVRQELVADGGRDSVYAAIDELRDDYSEKRIRNAIQAINAVNADPTVEHVESVLTGYRSRVRMESDRAISATMELRDCVAEANGGESA